MRFNHCSLGKKKVYIHSSQPETFFSSGVGRMLALPARHPSLTCQQTCVQVCRSVACVHNRYSRKTNNSKFEVSLKRDSSVWQMARTVAVTSMYGLANPRTPRCTTRPDGSMNLAGMFLRCFCRCVHMCDARCMHDAIPIPCNKNGWYAHFSQASGWKLAWNGQLPVGSDVKDDDMFIRSFYENSTKPTLTIVC